MTYAEYLDGKPVVITAALTGGVHGKETNPNIPETPTEIADAAADCEQAGATIVHLHARGDRGHRTTAKERFQTVTEAVRDECEDIIIQHSTGATGVALEDRIEPLLTKPRPDMASLDMGPVNRYRHLTSENTRHMIDTLYEKMTERGIKPELEVFNDGHLNESLALLRRQDVERPPYLTLIFGGGTTSPPHPRRLLSHVEELPSIAEFNVIGFGQHQLPMTTLSMLLGGHVRVGLEDNVYFRKDEPARSNAQLVQRSVEIATALGREPASTAETRAILNL